MVTLDVLMPCKVSITVIGSVKSRARHNFSPEKAIRRRDARVDFRDPG